jgi:hypothetical protein
MLYTAPKSTPEPIMARPRKVLEPVVAINVRLTEATVAEIDRLANELQAATTNRVSRADAMRLALDEFFARRAAFSAEATADGAP